MTTLSRRGFIKLSGMAGASLVLGLHYDSSLPGDGWTVTNLTRQSGPFEPNAYLRIDPDGTITIQVPRSELGQGVSTTLPALVAEELDAAWEQVQLEQAPPDSAYGDQMTGGSTSIQQYYTPMRRAGAVARVMLIAAAAQTWAVAPESCTTEPGAVLHPDSGRRLSYGELAATASTLEVPKPQDIQLKDPSAFRLIGTRLPSKYGPGIVTGAPLYGSDVRQEGMLVAAILHCPVLGGQVAAYDPAGALAIEGVRQVVDIGNAVAVVADSSWAALKGRDALDVTWDEGTNAAVTSAGIDQMLRDAAIQTTPPEPGDAVTYLEAVYEQPYLAHATMEPMVCAAILHEDTWEVWAPTQDRTGAKWSASTGADRDVLVRVPALVGGGFGRRLRTDYAGEAVKVAEAVGASVKLIWTREEDMQHDFYRPASLHWLRGGLDGEGLPVSWEMHAAGQGIGSQQDLLQGTPLLYQIKPATSRAHGVSLALPVGYWRAVFNNQTAFAVESFLDELAAAGGRDPYELRRSLLREGSAQRAVLDLAASQAGWGDPLPDGWGRGIALHTTWGVTHVAMVAEVSVEADGTVRVRRIVAAVDCGLPVNPSVIEAQVEGGIVMGLTAALYGEITFANGRVQQANFGDYPLLRINEMPVIDVHILSTDRSPSGLGEMPVPPVAPAVTNAICAATGVRVRRLPIRKIDLAQA